MKAVFSGGGTGGHLYPALSLIEYMKEEKIIDSVLYTGGKGIESRVVPNYNIKYLGFNIEGLRRPKRSLSNIKIILNYYKAALKLKKMMKKFNPDFVFVTGGYASIPVSMAARWLKIPLFNQEQNVYVGFANRYINKFSKVTFTNFEESLKYFARKDNVIVARNPIKRKKTDKVKSLKKFNLKEGFTIGVFGGSGGSEKINSSIREIYNSDKKNNYIHITGERFYDKFKKIDNKNVKVLKYCNDMDSFYSACDMVISRAGAMTVSELMFMKIPAILIPHPLAAENHQFYNAKFLESKGVALTIEDSKLNAAVLNESIKNFISNFEKFKESYKSIEYKNSMDLIAKKILEVLNERSN